MSYACEVWVVSGCRQGAIAVLEKVEVHFLRSLLGVQQNTSSKLVYAEFGRLSIRDSWLQQSLTYLQRMHRLGEQRLCKAAYTMDVKKGLGWHLGLCKQLRQFSMHLPRLLEDTQFQLHPERV